MEPMFRSRLRVALSDEHRCCSALGNGDVSLSQWGAANYAKYAGWDFQQMLSHYNITSSGWLCGMELIGMCI